MTNTPTPGSPLQILIVENEAIIAEDIRVTLIELGYNVVGIASSYEEATALLESVLPDFIMMDILLDGDKDGITLAADIQKKHNLPFLFLTSHSDRATLERAKAVHPSGYLLKPFEKEDIFTSIEVAMSNFNSRLLSSKVRTPNLNPDAPACIYVKDKHVYVRVPIISIHYLKSEGNYLHIYGQQFHHMLRATQKEVFDILPENQFIRVHRSFIVNVSSILAIFPDAVDVPNAKVPLQKGFREELMAKLKTI